MVEAGGSGIPSPQTAATRGRSAAVRYRIASSGGGVARSSAGLDTRRWHRRPLPAGRWVVLLVPGDDWLCDSDAAQPRRRAGRRQLPRARQSQRGVPALDTVTIGSVSRARDRRQPLGTVAFQLGADCPWVAPLAESDRRSPSARRDDACRTL